MATPFQPAVVHPTRRACRLPLRFGGIRGLCISTLVNMAEEQVEKKVSALMVLVAKQEERGVYVHMV